MLIFIEQLETYLFVERETESIVFSLTCEMLGRFIKPCNQNLFYRL